MGVYIFRAILRRVGNLARTLADVSDFALGAKVTQRARREVENLGRLLFGEQDGGKHVHAGWS